MTEGTMLAGQDRPIDIPGAERRPQERTPAYPSGTVRALLVTEHVTAPTREALLARLVKAPVTYPRFFTPAEFATLQAACARLIPQEDRSPPIDLAGLIDTRLATAKGNGWRYAAMPPDDVAFRHGLAGLDEAARALFGSPLAELDGPSQDAVLARVQGGDAPGDTWLSLPADRFFEELLAEATEFYYAHPLAQEEIGYAGMADAQGWSAIGLGERHEHEPRASLRAGELP